MSPSFLKNLFKKKNHDKNQENIKKIFDYLQDITKEKEITSQYYAEFEKIISQQKKNYIEELCHLYLVWEDFVISQAQFSKELISVYEIREKIADLTDLNILPSKFRLIFLKEPEQSLNIYEIFIKDIINYLLTTLGPNRLNTLLIPKDADDFFKKIQIDRNGINFEQINKAIYEQKYSTDQIILMFKALYNKLFLIIENSFGTKIAAGFFNQIYKNLQTTYNKEFAAIFLKTIPEQVLKFDEWLSTLSKEELEKKIQEKTFELETLNNSLEERIAERTKELKIAYEELKKLDEKKSDFISVAAHQLRTPLAGFKWTFDILLNDAPNLKEDQIRLIKQSYEANERMLMIVNDMLNTDLITGGKSSYVFKQFKINPVIKEIVNEFEQSALQKNIKVETKYDCEDNVEIQADQKQLEKAVQNFVDNAIKYTPQGGKIKIITDCDTKQFTFSIKDSGIGISEEDQKNLFSRFYRAKNAVRTHANGSGLGLFIAKSVIEAHSGKVLVKSQINKGTTFTFSIPINNN